MAVSRHRVCRPHNPLPASLQVAEQAWPGQGHQPVSQVDPAFDLQAGSPMPPLVLPATPCSRSVSLLPAAALSSRRTAWGTNDPSRSFANLPPTHSLWPSFLPPPERAALGSYPHPVESIQVNTGCQKLPSGRIC